MWKGEKNGDMRILRPLVSIEQPDHMESLAIIRPEVREDLSNIKVGDWTKSLMSIGGRQDILTMARKGIYLLNA